MFLQSIQPRVLVVEEAGQVLEAHILASLVDSGWSMHCISFQVAPYQQSLVQHLICIGDPKQLRPNLATYCQRFLHRFVHSRALNVPLDSFVHG